MQYAVLYKENFNDFIDILTKNQKVVAPVAKGLNNYSYEEISSGNEISLKHIPTRLPPKKYFMPQYEILIEYNTVDGQKMQAVVEYEDMIIFGVHTCDLEAIQCLDIVFSDRPKDLNYLIRKNSITLIGIECNDYCDEFASCCMMENHIPHGGYDLFFTDLGTYYFIHINTQKGEELIKNNSLFSSPEDNHFKELEALREKKKELFQNETEIEKWDIPELFIKGFESPVWDEVGNRCLSCGNCTNVCPTCYCFDVVDEPNIDLKTGRRMRLWDSCQLEPFAKVSGGLSFRKERCDRKRHRFNRKFKYPVDRYSKFFCTGCGRCSRTCMAKINLKETLKQLKKEYM